MVRSANLAQFPREMLLPVRRRRRSAHPQARELLLRRRRAARHQPPGRSLRRESPLRNLLVGRARHPLARMGRLQLAREVRLLLVKAARVLPRLLHPDQSLRARARKLPRRRQRAARRAKRPRRRMMQGSLPALSQPTSSSQMRQCPSSRLRMELLIRTPWVRLARSGTP